MTQHFGHGFTVADCACECVRAVSNFCSSLTTHPHAPPLASRLLLRIPLFRGPVSGSHSSPPVVSFAASSPSIASHHRPGNTSPQ
ncbi:unnamed protein product [Boreogadus saida]